MELRGEVFAIRPSVEWTRWQFDFSESDEFERFNTVNVLVHLSFVSGREKKQLNRMERKMDRILENQGDQTPPETDDSDYKGDEDIQR